MIYLFDTDTLIFMIRGSKTSNRNQTNRERAQTLVKRCRESQLAGHTLAVSAISVAELEFGARLAENVDRELQAIHKILSPFELLDFDAVNAPARYGNIRHELESIGQPIGAMDLLIAAHSVSIQATLVTNNTAHFSRITGLSIENWS